MKKCGSPSSLRQGRRLVYFGRMVDQIRAHAKGELPPEYQTKRLEKVLTNTA